MVSAISAAWDDEKRLLQKEMGSIVIEWHLILGYNQSHRRNAQYNVHTVIVTVKARDEP
jgi:hypothetical protein